MQMTIKEIAEMAGVHRSTVDKVLHKRPGVSDEVRKRIQRMLDELGYESNPLGKALNYQRRKIVIAAVLQEVDALSEIRQGVENAYADFKNFNVEVRYEVVAYDAAAEQADRLLRLKDEGVCGAVVCPVCHEKVQQAIEALADAGIPVITVNMDISESRRLCFVGQDLEKAGRVAARLMSLFLHDQGEVATVTGSAAMAQRETGFCTHIRNSNSMVQVAETIATRENPVETLKKTAELLRRRPNLNGLFVTCGCVPAVCQAVKAAGRADLVIVCFERYPQIEKYLEDGTISCTISSDLVGQGYQAMKLLFEYFMYDRRPMCDALHMDIGIVMRENL